MTIRRLRPCRKVSRRAHTEPLEGRTLFAGATVADGVWLVTADADRRSPADVILVAPVEHCCR